MGTSIAILALTAMKIMLTGGISDEILEGVLEKAADMGIDKAEEQLEQYKNGFNLNTQMDVCNVPYPKRDKVRDSIKAFMNYIELEKIAEACGADLDRFANELMNLYDLMYKENGENYEYIAKVLRNLAEHVLKNMDVKSYHEKKFLEICHAELKSELTETIEDTAAKSVEEIKKYIDETFSRIQGLVNDNKEDEKTVIINNRCTDYRDLWNKNLFLNKPKKRGRQGKQGIKLSDVYIVPFYKYNQEDEYESDIKQFLLEVATENEVDERMLVILGQPGSGKSSLITYFLNEYAGKLTRDVLVYRFTDFKNMDWNSNDVFEQFLQRTGMGLGDLSSKILILDGYDEIYVKNGEETLNHIKSTFAKNNMLKDFSLFITCRGNYIEAEKLNCDYITIQSLDETQIEKYYTTYIKKSQSADLAIPLDILIENKDIFGIPIVLYMTLASNIKITPSSEAEAGTKSTIVDIYDKIFDYQDGSGIYDVENYKDEAHRVWFQENKKKVHEASREIAVWMFQKNEGKEYIPLEEFGNIIRLKGMDAKEVKIGNFFRHCEGTEGEEKTSVCFVHRSIYQYFVAEAISSAVEEQIKAPTNKNREVFIKEIVPYIKEGEMDPTIGEYLKYKFEKAYGITKEKESLFLWLEDTLLDAVETGFCKVSGTSAESFLEYEKYEMNCFANMLIILFSCRKWNKEDRKVMQDKMIEKLTSYIRHNGIVVSHSFRLWSLDLKRANLIGANLKGADLRDADLIGANLRGAYLRNAYLFDTKLVGANLRDAYLFDAKLVGADLRGADLRGADLRDADLSGADLSVADLSVGANLRNAYLRNAYLFDAKLVGADLRDADLRGADLSVADLSVADLRGANLRNAYLNNTKLDGAIMLGEMYTEEERIEYAKRGVIFK